MFDFIKSKSSINDVELAYQLFQTLELGGEIDSKYEKPIRKIQNECTNFNDSPYPDRQLILLKVIELTGSPDTPMQRYLLAIAYAYSRANYREKAIYYLNLYLNNELWDTIIYQHSSTQNFIEGKKKHLIIMYHLLFKNYIGIYDFEKSLLIAEKMIYIYPECPTGYFCKVEVLTKLNKLQECKKWLQSVKKEKYYKIYTYKDALGREFKDNWFYSSINKMLKDTNEKIKKGYTYKPRKQK